MRASQLQKTINYAAFFNASLTTRDLHFWLISSKKHSLTRVHKLLKKYPTIKRKLISPDNPVFLKKNKLTKKKIKSIKNLISVLKLVPTIELIALTGSLSMSNPKKQDDIDLMIIVSPNTLWLTRPLVILISSLLSTRRKPNTTTTANTICINLWLDRLALVVPKEKQNLYTAHEVLQIKPLFDRGDVHQEFTFKNAWVKKHLATAYSQINKPLSISPVATHKTFWLTQLLNKLLFNIQYLYMKSKITKEHITPHSAYFHPRSLYLKIKKHLF